LGLKGKLRPLLELESGSNDPMAVFLTIGMIQLLTQPEIQVTDLIGTFFLQIIVGVLCGFFFGKLLVFLANRIGLGFDGLYPVLTLSIVFLAYSVTNTLYGNGFLAVYLAGIVAGHQDFVHRRSVIRFHDGAAWLMQITMFLTLGLLVFPSEIPPIITTGLLVAASLIFLARPISIFLTLLPTSFTFKEKVFLSWVGLRGAVPIILATYPLLAGLPQADSIFNIVFFVVLTSATSARRFHSLRRQMAGCGCARGQKADLSDRIHACQRIQERIKGTRHPRRLTSGWEDHRRVISAAGIPHHPDRA
jgi:potassium/hydrogen antiporter